MKILIIGGGIAGPAVAIQLKKHNVACEITLIEQAPEFKNIGYGLAIWGNGRSVLKEIGIDQGIIRQNGYEVPWEAFETIKHKYLQAFFLEQFRKYGPTVAMPRSMVHKTLIDQLDPATIRLGTKLKRIINNNSDGAEVEFTDGIIEKFDLIISADGIHSWTRTEVFGPNYLKPYGYSFWMFWMPSGFKFSNGIVGMAGSGKFIFSYPGEGKGIMMLAMKRKPGQFDDPSTRKELLLKNFGEFGQEIAHMIKALKPEDPILFSDAQFVTMPVWHKDRVVLIGDAQHAVSPLTGMGASLALEDACVLAQELAKNSNIDEALVAFDSRRSKRVSKFKKQIIVFEKIVLARGIIGKLRNLFMPFIPKSILMKPIVDMMEGEM